VSSQESVVRRGELRFFTDLKAWQETHLLGLEVYRVTKAFPREEVFGLTAQIRRSAVSIPSNIAEGFNRTSRKEKAQFYSVAMGSLAELQSQLHMARDLGFLSTQDHKALGVQAELGRKLIAGMIRSLLP
jgi:four helix bundle protein